MAKENEIIEVSGSPSVIIQQAVDKGADLEKLEKLLALRERYEANEARKAYHQAMSDFKAKPPKINKDKKVGYKTEKGNVGYAHASLYNVTEKINSDLSKYGLSASWTTKQNGAISVTCRITHVQGHSEETTLTAPADSSGAKNAIQAIGSTITYLERYTLLALTGLATFDQDDDGKATAIVYINDEELSAIMDWIAQKSVDVKRFCDAFKIESVEKLPKDKYQQAISMLKAKVVKK